MKLLLEVKSGSNGGRRLKTPYIPEVTFLVPVPAYILELPKASRPEAPWKETASIPDEWAMPVMLEFVVEIDPAKHAPIPANSKKVRDLSVYAQIRRMLARTDGNDRIVYIRCITEWKRNKSHKVPVQKTRSFAFDTYCTGIYL